MTINEATIAIEELLATLSIVAGCQVRPSGDDVDVIKVWVELADAKLDPAAAVARLEEEIRARVPGAASYRLQVRAEAGA